jgi:hypothetical protein
MPGGSGMADVGLLAQGGLRDVKKGQRVARQTGKVLAEGSVTDGGHAKKATDRPGFFGDGAAFGLGPAVLGCQRFHFLCDFLCDGRAFGVQRGLFVGGRLCLLPPA